MFQPFNLSRHKFLRTLEITAESISDPAHVWSCGAGPDPSDFLKAVLSSISSPGPLDIVVIYRDIMLPYDGRYEKGLCHRPVWLLGRIVINEETLQQQFRVFREMHSVRDFRLVLSVDPFGCAMNRITQLMEMIVNAEKAKGGFDYLSCEPLMVYEKRMPRSRTVDYRTGACGEVDFKDDVYLCFLACTE